MPIRRTPDGTPVVIVGKVQHSMAMRILFEDLPTARPEYQFVPERGWRFDYAWPDYKVALEIEGGVYNRGRHVRGEGYETDLMKYNEATLRGWRLIRFSVSQVLKKPTLCHQILQSAFRVEAEHAKA